MTKKELLSEMTFLPWEGPYYNQGFRGKKVLVVGESYYRDPEWTDNPDNFLFASPNAVQKFIFGWNQSTFRIFTNIMLGKGKGDTTTTEERASLWNHVVYYNFIQSGLRANATDKNAIPNHWLKEGKKILKDILSIYNPDLTIVYSKQVWVHYRDYNGVKYSDKYRETDVEHSTVANFDLKDNDGNVHHIIGISHPSSPSLSNADSWNEINTYLATFLN